HYLPSFPTRRSSDLHDWMYFFEPTPFDPVPAGKERTWIWNADGFKTGRHVMNAREYTGYLLYAYGIQSAELRSGGEPSRDGGFQDRKSTRLNSSHDQ